MKNASSLKLLADRVPSDYFFFTERERVLVDSWQLNLCPATETPFFDTQAYQCITLTYVKSMYTHYAHCEKRDRVDVY